MKKLMIAAAAAAMIGGASAIESANIVGYQQVSLGAKGDSTLYTPTFKDVAGKTYIDLTEIMVVNTATPTAKSANKIMIYKLNQESGILSAPYSWNKPKNGDGFWQNALTEVKVVAGDVTFATGEAMFVNNGDSANMVLQFSGQVEITPLSTVTVAKKYNLIGNCTPNTVDLMNIEVRDADGNEFAITKKSANKIMIYKLVANTGVLGVAYSWNKAKNAAGFWQNALTEIPVSANDVTFAPGESMFVYNGDSADITFKHPSPIAK